MTTFEKFYSVFSIIFAFFLLTVLIVLPESRQLKPLLLLSSLGLLINIGFIFIILKHIMLTAAFPQKDKILWVILILLFWPAAIVYLVKHGFRKSSSHTSE